MAWKDNLRPASFKGAGFFVETSERAGGRLGTTYQYPSPSRGQNDADEGRPSFFEDLGRQPRAFSLDGYVVGDDYMSARDTLLAALESRGAGTLVHPYFGSAVVAAKSFRVRESSADGRMARFSIDFEETPGEPTQPSATADTKGQLQVAATAARTVAADSFTATYKPGTYMDRVAAILADTATALRSKILQTVTDVQAAAALNGQISSLTSDAAALAATPSALLAALGDILTTVGLPRLCRHGGYAANLSGSEARS